MRHLLCTLASLTLAAGPAAAQGPANSLTAEEKRGGWQLLFDGKALTGWEARPTSVPTTNGDWTVAQGAILCPGTNPGWLSTAAMFDNFHLKLEFRGAAGVNSGIFIRSRKEGQPHVTGYEVQVWDNQPAGFNTGSLVGTVKAGPASIIPDAWNSFEITADGDQFRVALNGKMVLEAKDSKHLSPGVIGFQCQKGNRIEFRSIRLKVLRK
jgi:hypothetical protein